MTAPSPFVDRRLWDRRDPSLTAWTLRAAGEATGAIDHRRRHARMNWSKLKHARTQMPACSPDGLVDDLIAIDEAAITPLDVGAELLFQISPITERAALILTTNLPFSEWTQVIQMRGCAKRSSTASPIARTSSTPATTPIGFAAPSRSGQRKADPTPGGRGR